MDRYSTLLVMTRQEFAEVAPSSLDARWVTSMALSENGDINGAARLITVLLEKSLSLKQHITHVECIEGKELGHDIDALLIDIAINSVSNMAQMKGPLQRPVVTMLCRAADAGLIGYSSRAANGLMGLGRDIDDLELAQSYFKITISTSKNDAERAAAFVNYCPIIRDGLLSGTPDLPKALEIYERAAKLNLNIAMFDAGVVAMKLHRNGNETYFTKADYWFRRLIERIENKSPMLETDSPELMPELLNNTFDQLAFLHIVDRSHLSDLEFGIELATRYEPITDNDAIKKTWMLHRGLTRRIMALDRPRTNTPVSNWHHLLSSLGWMFDEVDQIPGLPISTIGMSRHRQGLHLVVADFMVFPNTSEYVHEKIRGLMSSRGIQEYFLLASHGCFKEVGGRIYTPIEHVKGQETYCLCLSAITTPEILIKKAESGSDFIDESMASMSPVISIAINLLNAGSSPKQGLDLNCRHATLSNGWCIPTPNGADLPPIINGLN